MSEIEDKIEKLRQEIRETPYHKGTEHHIGRLKARIAQLQDEAVEKRLGGGGGGGAGGFFVKKHGDATVVLIGFPSVGKSTILNALTSAHSRVAEYAFTTLSVVPGMMEYKGSRIQIFDVPGFIEGAASGRGRGKEILAVAKIADLLMIVIDAKKPEQIDFIEKELFEAGIRINKKAPQVFIKKLLRGGLKIVLPSKSPISKEEVEAVAAEYDLENAEIHIKERMTIDEFIDSFAKSRVYLPAIYIVNKADLLKPKQIEKIKEQNLIPLSAQKGENLDSLKEVLWQNLGFIRVYLKPENGEPDMDKPLVLRDNLTVLDAAEKISGEIIDSIKEAKVWGTSAKYPGQIVSLTHRLEDSDILTLVR